jgi:CubicO group peptidase (beta-lactamase class C family)
LKMTHSGFATMAAIVPQMSEGYSREGSTLRHREYFDRSMETGAGGIYATAEDLLRWNKALDSPGLLSAHAPELMFTAHPPGNYGYGCFVETSPRRKIYHEGGDPGFAAFEACYLISMSSLLFWPTRMIPRSGILQTPWQSICLVTEYDALQDLLRTMLPKKPYCQR